jgi:hypothetical protein
MKILLRFSFLWLYIEYFGKCQFFPEEIYKIVNENMFQFHAIKLIQFHCAQNDSGILLPITANF